MRQGIGEPYTNIMEEIYSGGTATIKLHQKSEKIPIKKELKQCDTTSPKLFTACLEEVFKKLYWEDIGININGEHLNNLKCSDDTVLLSELEDKTRG